MSGAAGAEGRAPRGGSHPAGALGPRGLAGWALLLLALGYAGFLHHGLGPLPDGALEPWSPREFLLRRSWIEAFELRPLLGVAAFAFPAALLAAAVFALTRSAVVRTLAVASVVACMLFAFYGLRPPGPAIWSFFGWRGSAVMVGLALCLAATMTAPLLARSWLALPTATRIAVYLPVLAGAVAMLRNVTGTDPSLRFAISPWPVIPLFGLKVGAVAIVGVIGGMACAAFAFAPSREGRRPWAARRAAGWLLAALLPALWFKAWHPSFPVRGMLTMAGVAALFACAALLGARGEGLRARRRHLGFGFLLALVPLVLGEAWAGYDYTRTREGAARVVIDALAAYYQDHGEYPESLSTLVEGDYLASVPRPKIGFSFLGDQEFEYQSFGTGYNLEFSSPDWVQCAYNPPWSEEEWDGDGWTEEEPEERLEEEEPEPEAGDEALDEAWSCPSTPPELW